MGISDWLVVLFIVTAVYGATWPSVRRMFKVPLNIDKVVKNEATVAVDFDGDKFDVTYRPNVVTPRWMKNLTKIQSDAERQAEEAQATWNTAQEKDYEGEEVSLVDLMAEVEEKSNKVFEKLLKELIVQWDIESGGKRMPVSTNTIETFPSRLTNKIMDTVVEDATGGSDEDQEETKKE